MGVQLPTSTGDRRISEHVEVGSLEAVVASMRMHQSDAELQRDGACDSCPVQIFTLKLT